LKVNGTILSHLMTIIAHVIKWLRR
jgi:hypothetical protein